uniref:Uncharacterized protein n=1 Tax=Arundo donax TaxID=35708 RepID=A0A0A9DLQ9_ARUDO
MSREDRYVKFEIDSSSFPKKWLLLALKKSRELEDSFSLGQTNGICPERLLLLTSRWTRCLLQSKDSGRVPVSTLLDKSSIAVLGSI